MKQGALYAHIGTLIKARRKHFKLTQERLAARIKISRASLANIETGRQTILVHQLYALATVLELSPADLLPPVVPLQAAKQSADLPLPEGLKPQVRAQIERVFAEPNSTAVTPKGQDHGKQTTR